VFLLFCAFSCFSLLSYEVWFYKNDNLRQFQSNRKTQLIAVVFLFSAGKVSSVGDESSLVDSYRRVDSVVCSNTDTRNQSSVNSMETDYVSLAAVHSNSSVVTSSSLIAFTSTRNPVFVDGLHAKTQSCRNSDAKYMFASKSVIANTYLSKRPPTIVKDADQAFDRPSQVAGRQQLDTCNTLKNFERFRHIPTGDGSQQTSDTAELLTIAETLSDSQPRLYSEALVNTKLSNCQTLAGDRHMAYSATRGAKAADTSFNRMKFSGNEGLLSSDQPSVINKTLNKAQSLTERELAGSKLSTDCGVESAVNERLFFRSHSTPGDQESASVLLAECESAAMVQEMRRSAVPWRSPLINHIGPDIEHFVDVYKPVTENSTLSPIFPSDAVDKDIAPNENSLLAFEVSGTSHKMSEVLVLDQLVERDASVKDESDGASNNECQRLPVHDVKNVAMRNPLGATVSSKLQGSRVRPSSPLPSRRRLSSDTVNASNHLGWRSDIYKTKDTTNHFEFHVSESDGSLQQPGDGFKSKNDLISLQTSDLNSFTVADYKENSSLAPDHVDETTGEYAEKLVPELLEACETEQMPLEGEPEPATNMSSLHILSKKMDGSKCGRHVSFSPLALLLDASLEGDMELVKATAKIVSWNFSFLLSSLFSYNVLLP
jgi:hypothetical protein